MEMGLCPFLDTEQKICLQNECNHNFPPSTLSHCYLCFSLFTVCCVYSDVWLCRDLLYTHANTCKKEIWATLKFFLKCKEDISFENLHWVLLCDVRAHKECTWLHWGAKHKVKREQFLSNPKYRGHGITFNMLKPPHVFEKEKLTFSCAKVLTLQII